jgi:hypothetical protein
MAFTYSLSTDRGKVRLLIPDNRAAAYVFEDDEIDSLLVLEGSNLRRAAALALETIASDQARVLKVMQVQEIRTDGAKVADALMKRAAHLRELAAEGDPSSTSLDTGFAIAQRPNTEQGYDDLIYREELKTL